MELPVYPASDLDRSETLLASLGSFWHSLYAGNGLVSDILNARAYLEAQAFLDTLETLQTLSRHTVPTFHKENWKFLQLRLSDMNSVGNDLLHYDDGIGLYNGTYQYGVAIPRSDSVFTSLSDLRDCRVIFNRVTNASVGLIRDVDFKIDTTNNVIYFKQNPFNNQLISQTTVVDSTGAVDAEIGLWLFRGDYERNTMYQQYGYIVGLQGNSSQEYSELINAVFDSLVLGSAATQLDLALSAITDVPLVQEPVEVVELITEDATGLLIITDMHVYRFSNQAVPIVSVGETVYSGQSLTDAYEIFEFNSGVVPSDLFALSVGRGILSTGYYQDLVFRNASVPLDVTVDSNGNTQVQFEVGGYPSDVELFWDTVNANGIASGNTLANMLDTRANKSSPPTADTLPQTINPLQFLISNVLRNNAFLVRIKLPALGPKALGLENTRILRKIIPPQTAMIVLLEYVISEELVMEQAPSATSPGYNESLGVYRGLAPASETISPASYISENVTMRTLSGRCG